LERSLGLPPERASTITNGFDSADIPQSTNAAARPDQALHITYLGSIIGTRATAAQGLFAALARLASSGITAANVQVRLIGIFDRAIYSWAQPFEASGMVQVLPFMPQSQAYAEMVASDVLLLIASDDREGQLSHPNKLFEYFAVGRPVLAIAPEGDISRLVRDANVGEAVSPSDVDGIEAVLRRMIREHKVGGERVLQTHANQFARFERRELTRQLANRLDRLVS
jgi:glycosyltransferase involved in cell wall biosynthesis